MPKAPLPGIPRLLSVCQKELPPYMLSHYCLSPLLGLFKNSDPGANLQSFLTAGIHKRKHTAGDIQEYTCIVIIIKNLYLTTTNKVDLNEAALPII